MIDIEQIRNQTPGCATGSIFLSSAGSSLQPESVCAVVSDYFALEAQVGGYEAQTRSREQFEAVYDIIAGYLSCSRDEIALVENATRAWQSIFLSIQFKPGDTIITSQSEYHSNVIPMLQCEKYAGVKLIVIPNNAAGEICLDALEAAMDHTVRLVSLTHVPSNNGLVNNAQMVGQIAKRFGALFLLDACQSIGQMPLAVDDLHCDFLVASGRKFLRGPRGTGFLYARTAAHQNLVPAILDGHAACWSATDCFEVRNDARKYETWEKNIGLFLGLGEAVRYADEIGMPAIWKRVQDLAAYTRSLLAAIPGVTVHDTGSVQSGIVTFSIENMKPCGGFKDFAAQHVFLGYTGVQSTRFDMEARQLDCIFRASVHYFNTEQEIERFADIVGSFVTGSFTRFAA